MRYPLLSTLLVFIAACASPTADGPVPKPDEAGKADGESLAWLCDIAGEPRDCDVCSVHDWYADGSCDGFCDLVDPDCVEAIECGMSSPFPPSVERERVRRIERAEAQDLDAVLAEQIFTSITHVGPRDADELLYYRQVLLSEVRESLREEMFDVPDDGAFTYSQLSADGALYDVITMSLYDEWGTVFRAGTVEIVAEVNLGDTLGCQIAVCDGRSPARFEAMERSAGEMWANHHGLTEAQLDQIWIAEVHLGLQTAEDYRWSREVFLGEIQENLKARLFMNGAILLAELYEGGASDAAYDVVELNLDGRPVGVVFDAGTNHIAGIIDDGVASGCADAR